MWAPSHTGENGGLWKKWTEGGPAQVQTVNPQQWAQLQGRSQGEG